MTWLAVANKDFNDAVRSYWLWGLSVVFVLILALAPTLEVANIINITAGQDNQVTTDIFILFMRDTMTIFVPIISIVIAYAAIARERDSGTLKLLLSLPHSRLDVVIGKVAGRSAVIVFPVLLGFLITALVILATPIALKPGNYFLFALLTAFLGVVFVGIAVGISAAANSSRRAMIGTVGIYVVFTLFWNQLSNGVITLLQDRTDIAGETAIKLHVFIKILNPTQGYKSLTASLLTDNAAQARATLMGGSGIQGQINQQVVTQVLGDSVPIYLTDSALVVILVLWLAVVPSLGYIVFQATDL